MKPHAELQHDIPLYIAGKLGAEDREQVERHLAVCDECCELVTTAEAVATGVRTESGEEAAEHPEPSVLREYAARPGAPDLDPVARHLRTCETCALELDAFAGSGGQSAATVVPIDRGKRAARWGSMAAGALLGAAATLAAVMLVGRPASPVRPATTGPAPRLEVAPPLRGEAVPRAAVRVGPDGTTWVVLVDLPTPRPGDGTSGFRVEIVDVGGSVTWNAEVARAEVERSAGQRPTVILPFLIQVGEHPPGSYAVRVLMNRDGRLDPIVEQPFDIELQGGP